MHSGDSKYRRHYFFQLIGYRVWCDVQLKVCLCVPQHSIEATDKGTTLIDFCVIIKSLSWQQGVVRIRWITVISSRYSYLNKILPSDYMAFTSTRLSVPLNHEPSTHKNTLVAALSYSLLRPQIPLLTVRQELKGDFPFRATASNSTTADSHFTRKHDTTYTSTQGNNNNNIGVISERRIWAVYFQFIFISSTFLLASFRS